MPLVAVKIKSGSQFSIYVLEQDGKCELVEFLGRLSESNPVEVDRMHRYWEKMADHGHIKTKEQFKHLGDKLYEFRTHGGVRVFAFFDAGKIVVCTNGYVKKKDKHTPSEVQKARILMAKYFDGREKNTLKFVEEEI